MFFITNTMNEKFIKIIGGLLAVIVILNFLLVIFKIISWKIFWIVILFAAFIAYILIPYLKKK